ncbi:MAG TPA: protein phosphatase 2C domain-containing protein [Polyangia bacterium]|jgi:hypothetical protein
MRAFAIAGGSVTGRAHVATGKPNQDAFAWAAGPGALACVACDGCGSAPHSEVGAQLGARLAAAALLERLTAGDAPSSAALRAAVHAELCATLGELARAMSPSMSGYGSARLARTVEDCFLFTIVAAVVTPAETAILALGDGLLATDGDVVRLGPFPNNEPPYLGYALLEAAPPPPRLQLQLQRVVPTAALRTLLIGTDGAAELAAARPLDDLWRDGRCFANPDVLRRRLTVLRREGAGQPGLIVDDTTLVVVTRREGN